jgi:hypothetical protein
MVEPDDSNRIRSCPRVHCATPVKASTDWCVISGTCRSISRGGLFMSGLPLPVGSAISLELALDGEPVRAQGEIRYHAILAGELGMGIVFTVMSFADLLRVRGFI